MSAREIVVSGRVQGVGFRAFTHRLALQTGIGGAVWNCATGEVQIHAEHPDSDRLDDFVARLQREGPGRVDHVRVVPVPPSGVIGFRVEVSH